MIDLELISMCRLTGDDFFDALILQVAAVAIAFGWAEWVTRRAAK